MKRHNSKSGKKKKGAKLHNKDKRRSPTSSEVTTLDEIERQTEIAPHKGVKRQRKESTDKGETARDMIG